MFDLKYVGELLKAIGFKLIEDHCYERNGMVVEISKKPVFICGGIFLRVGKWDGDDVTIRFLALPLYALNETDFASAINTCEVLYSHYKA